MSSPWASLFVPLSKGLDFSKEATLGTDELRVASNVDFAVDGSVRGRPARAAPKNFAVLDPTFNAGGATPTYNTAVAFNSTGFTPRGMLRLRDAAGERAALACDGRLFSQEGARWTDRGPFACARVDRLFNYYNSRSAPATNRATVAPDFGIARGVGGIPVFGLLASNNALDRELGGGFAMGTGNSARCGTTTATVVRNTGGDLVFIYRVNGADTLSAATLASTTAMSHADTGDAPAICCSRDATNFWVAFRTTTANVVKVLNVSITGTVNATYTSAAIAGVHGIWIDNTTIAGNRVALAFAHTGGVTIRTLNATTMADIGVDSTYDGSGGAGTVGRDVVVGCQSDTVCWWAYRNSNAVGDGDIVVGTATIGTATSAVLVRKFWGGDTYTEASIRWGIGHQPVYVNGRMYMTLIAGRGRSNTGTWLTLDLTNWFNTGATTGPFANPTLVARGPTEGTYPHLQPSAAVVISDSTGWTFPCQDWSRFEISTQEDGNTAGTDALNGLTRVTLSRPKSAQAGESTIFSGSVPHVVQRGQCAELGFPFLAGIPGLSVTATGGGAVGIGDYGLAACWRWTDESGQVHRSSPSAIQTCTISGGNNTITAVVTNPWLTERATADLRIELYTTGIDPTEDDYHQFSTSVAPVYTAAYTTITIATQPAVTTPPFPTDGTEILYTDGDVFANIHVAGDGGVAALGRRLWLAGANKVFASKYLLPGVAPEFNDQGQLQIDLPAGVGRVVALEALDDKLVIFCERGVYLVQDGGPDNTGIGPDFPVPFRVSDLGIAGPRSSCTTDAGIIFCSTLDTVDPSRGGPWLIDRQLTVTERQYLGRAALTYFLRTNSWVPEVAYSPERQQVYITADSVGSSDGVIVMDMRVGKWSTWDLRDASWGALRSITCVSGVLWALSNEPAPFDATPGTDAGAAGAYAMSISTSHLAADGRDGAGWSRVRSITPMGAEGTGAHTLTITAVQDSTRSSNSGGVSVPAQSADTTWPSTRQAWEWRVPSQKCSTMQVTLSATPAVARWAAIRLDVAPLPNKAPAKNRS